MKQQCNACKRQFTLTKSQQKLVESQRGARQLAALTCPLCGKTFFLSFAAEKKASTHPQFRCPVSHCAGWVDYITEQKGRPFWGCGECGSQWFDVENLYREIAAIQVSYPYRRKCYKPGKSNEWVSVALEKQPKDYEERVEQEPVDGRNEYVRG